MSRGHFQGVQQRFLWPMFVEKGPMPAKKKGQGTLRRRARARVGAGNGPRTCLGTWGRGEKVAFPTFSASNSGCFEACASLLLSKRTREAYTNAHRTRVCMYKHKLISAHAHGGAYTRRAEVRKCEKIRKVHQPDLILASRGARRMPND